ncbi:MAG: hypothetical protein QOJ44_1809 [Acidimicrobiaceae bacterium]|nr:hypothetical protein [Acidimicrobiaceae bacterium]
MQLHQLAYVLAVAEERSFTRAAARLHLAQPSLSRQVRLLEHELSVRLFDRRPGQSTVDVTGDGEALLPFLRRVLADVDATTAEARALTGLATGHLTIGATPSLATSLLPQALARFHQRHPEVALAVVEAGSGDLVPRVAAGEVDLALVVLPVSHGLVDTQPLFEDQLVLIVTAAHPFARRDHVQVTDLADLPLVMFRPGYDLRDATLAACRQAGIEVNVVVEGGEMDGVLALVGAGLGAAIVPEVVAGAAPNLVSLPFAEPGLKRTVALAYRNDRPLSRTAQTFTALLDVPRQ